MWTCRDAGRPQPPNGKTLALLCLKSVKHRDKAEIRREARKSMEILKKCSRMAVSQPAFGTGRLRSAALFGFE
jgi:hypothetical protein